MKRASVMDADLKVYGIENLRTTDRSPESQRKLP